MILIIDNVLEQFKKGEISETQRDDLLYTIEEDDIIEEEKGE